MLERQGIVYDIEVFPNLYTITGMCLGSGNIKVWEKSERKDNLSNFIEILLRFEPYLIGYNNHNFDDYLIEFLCRPNGTKQDNKRLYDEAQKLIRGESELTKKKYGRKRHPKLICKQTYDLMEIARAGYNTPSLKSIAVNLKHRWIQDLPYSPHQEIKKDQIDEIIEYNKNDVEITRKLFWKVKDRIDMRNHLSKIYNVSLESASDSSIAKKLLNKWYLENSGCTYNELRKARTEHTTINCNDIIYDWIDFRSEKLQSFLEKLKTKTIERVASDEKRDKFDIDLEPVEYGGIKYTIALGGIHSQDKSIIRYPKENEILLDLDVASQYPNAILNNGLCPEHLDKNVFLPLLQSIVDDRLYHKKHKKESKESDTIQSGLKITVNTIYGLLNSKTYWLFDPKVTFTVTLNNQLMLLMLIERLVDNGVKVISANTDGILIDDKTSNLELIRNIYKDWEKQTGFELEETQYKSLVRRDVNNYFAKDIDGNLKTKGLFEVGGLTKGFVFPVISLALQEYFEHGASPETFIKEHNDIFDFCCSQKVGKQFENVLELVERTIYKKSPKTAKKLKNPKIYDAILEEYPQQKTLRYFVANPLEETGKKEDINWQKGYRLRKRKTVSGEYSYTDYVAGYFVEILNYKEENDTDYFNRVNYQFYIDRIWKEIEKIQPGSKPIEKTEETEEQMSLTLF